MKTITTARWGDGTVTSVDSTTYSIAIYNIRLDDGREIALVRNQIQEIGDKQ